MPPEVVGTAYVRIRAITTKLASDIADGVNKGADDAKADVDATGEKVGRRIGAKAGDAITDTVREKLGDNLTDALDDAVTSNDRDHRGIFSRLGERVSTAFHDGWTRANEPAARKQKSRLQKQFSDIYRSLMKFKVPLPIWLGYFGMPVIVGAAKTAFFYIGGLVARIGTLAEAVVGGSVAMGGALLSTIAIFGLLSAAFKAETPELERFKASMSELGPAWKSVAQETQRGLFPGLGESARLLTRVFVPKFRELGRNVGQTAGAWSVFISRIAATPQGLRAFDAFSVNTTGIANDLGRIGAALVRIVLPLMEKVMHVSRQFSDAIADTAERWADIVESPGRADALGMFFQEGYDAAKQLTGALGDIFIGFWNIMRIGSQVSGLSAFDRFEEFAQRFRDFTASGAGENKIRRFFEEAEPVIREVNGLIADIFRMFFQGVEQGTGSDTLVSVLQTLRNDVLPAIADAIKQISDSMGESISWEDLLKQFTELISLIVEAETLIPTIQVITGALEALITLLSLPVIGDIVGILLALGAAARLLKVLGVGTILSAVGSALGFFLNVLGGTTGLTLGTQLLAIAQGLFSIQGGAAAASPALAAFGTAAAPIIAIIGAVAAVVTGLYFVLDPVREAIDGIWESIQEVWDQISKFDITDWQGNLRAGLQMLVTFVTAIPRVVLAIFQGLGEKLLQLIGNIPGWLGNLGGLLVDGFSMAWSAVTNWWDETAFPFISSIPGRIGELLSTAGEAIGGWISDGASKAGEALGSFWSDTLLPWLQQLPGRVTAFVSTLPGLLWGWIQRAVPQVAYWIGYLIGALMGILLSLPQRIADFLVNTAAPALWGWIQQAIPIVWGWLVSLAVTVFNWVVSLVTAIPGWIGGAAAGLWGWIQEALPVVTGKLAEVALAVWGWVTGFLAELPGRIVGAIEGITSWVTEAALSLPGKLSDLGVKIYEWASALPGRIVEWLGDVAGKFWDVGTDIVQGIIDGVGSMAGVLKDAAANLAGGFLDGFKSFLGIESPSKVMMEQGVWTMKGFTLGVQDEFAKTKALFRQMTDQLTLAPSFSATAALRTELGGVSSSTPQQLQSLIDLVAAGRAPTLVTVKIGETELRQIVKTEVDDKDSDNAKRATARIGFS